MHLPKHELTMTVLMTPDMANFTGNVHGGTILKLLDQVAYACASRYAARYVVTLSVDQVMFREPIHVGELVTFLASVNYTGTTSMEVGIKVLTENIQTQSVRSGNLADGSVAIHAGFGDSTTTLASAAVARWRCLKNLSSQPGITVCWKCGYSTSAGSGPSGIEA